MPHHETGRRRANKRTHSFSLSLFIFRLSVISVALSLILLPIATLNGAHRFSPEFGFDHPLLIKPNKGIL
jgi:hypothetical protein